MVLGLPRGGRAWEGRHRSVHCSSRCFFPPSPGAGTHRRAHSGARPALYPGRDVRHGPHPT
eukprot:1737806-Alexandrium_andersonii.AAC.1